MLAWLGSGLVVVAAGVWAVFTYLVPPSGSDGGGEAAPRVQVERGVGAGGNISVGRDLRIEGGAAHDRGQPEN